MISASIVRWINHYLRSTSINTLEHPFSDQEMLNNHIEAKHTPNKPPVSSFMCRICEKEFIHEFELKNHLCLPDSKSLKVTLIELVDHMQAKHVKKVTVKVSQTEGECLKISCDECNYKCKYNIQLEKHKKEKHAEPVNKPHYSCDKCDYKTVHLPEIWMHKAAKHSEEPTQFNLATNSSIIFLNLAQAMLGSTLAWPRLS